MVCRYYSLDVKYFKSSLDSQLLDLLWNKYWVDTLSSSPLTMVMQCSLKVVVNSV